MSTVGLLSFFVLVAGLVFLYAVKVFIYESSWLIESLIEHEGLSQRGARIARSVVTVVGLVCLAIGVITLIYFLLDVFSITAAEAPPCPEVCELTL